MKKRVYTVGQVNAYIKNMFIQDYMLNRIHVKGEVSNCKYHFSGHIYFTLKDETGTIACVMFAGNRKGLSFLMEEGQEVIVLGEVNVYERDGKYQIYAREIVLDGEGDLYQQYEKLKKELAEMGMFAEEYKQPIPRFCHKVGVVTAATGAAVRDIINVASRRNPYVQLILYPAQVQGEGASQSVVKGIETLDQYGVDVMIVGRGGGSIEDLWAFNEENVARAAFHCATPLISAVGHETDFTILDFVADMRAPTPSAAAELAVYEWDMVKQQLDGSKKYLKQLMLQHIGSRREKLDKYAMELKYVSPLLQLRQKQQYLADLEEKLLQIMKQNIREKKHQLALYIQQFQGQSPLMKLKQGYVFATDSKSAALQSVSQVREKDTVTIQVLDGELETRVVKVRPQNRGLSVDDMKWNL